MKNGFSTSKATNSGVAMPVTGAGNVERRQGVPL